MKQRRTWLLYAFLTTLFWGIWGAFIETPEKAGFPATLGYVVWAMTMVPCALVALFLINWKLDYNPKSIFLGSTVGLLGAGGQLILFQALREGPAYVVFPLISLFPVVTIFLALLFLREKASKRQWIGITTALVAIFFLSYQTPTGAIAYNTWLLLSIIVFLMWGIQAFVMRFSNERMKAESIFFYMMITALALIPVALWMTDFNMPVNMGWNGPYLAFLIHILNSAGALMLVYALRHGKAIVVVPMTGLSPIITVVISLAVYSILPGATLTIGVLLAMIAIYLLSE
jgi:uncharacterized membrane protein